MGWFSLSGIKDGKNVELQPKSGQSVGRYFPELIFALKEIKTKKLVLDCEIVLPVQGSFSFDLCCREFTLLKAGSRICLKSRPRTRSGRGWTRRRGYPANLIVFDLLIFADWKLLGQPLKERGWSLQIFFAQYLAQNLTFQLSPVTHLDRARRWLKMAGERLDGVIAKRLDLTYQSGERSGMRQADAYR